MKKTAILAAALAIVSLGCDELKTEDPVAEKYRGEWQFAELASGQTNPTALGCEVHDLVHSRKGELLVEKDKVTTKYLYYVLNGNCDSESTFTLDTSVNLKDTDTNDDKDIFEASSFRQTLSLGNSAAAGYFIAQGICGHSTWNTIATYYESDDSIKGCTSENDGGFGLTLPTEDQINNLVVRLQIQGDGIAYGTKTKAQPDEEFANGQKYYLKK